MVQFLTSFTLSQISSVISIITPVVLLFWFYYSRKQILSKSYYSEIDGIYAGFPKPISLPTRGGAVNAEIIMNIRDVNESGYFKGEFDFAEAETFFLNRIPISNINLDGFHSFLGKLKFTLYQNRSRHPFKPKENRTYLGKLYVIERLDFAFEGFKVEDYLKCEYDIIHHREMQTLKFTLTKTHKDTDPALPKSFVLYKSFGFAFEPYKNVKKTIFVNGTRVDKNT